MNNGKQSAFPLCFEDKTLIKLDEQMKSQKLGRLQLEGLTKREYFAGLAMQGILASNKHWVEDYGEIIKLSVKMADDLLNELEITPAK